MQWKYFLVAVHFVLIIPASSDYLLKLVEIFLMLFPMPLGEFVYFLYVHFHLNILQQWVILECIHISFCSLVLLILIFPFYLYFLRLLINVTSKPFLLFKN